MEVVITKSTKNNKQYDARIDGTKTISFGQKGASDFTKHKDTDRKDRYIDRHQARYYWTKSGAKAAGCLQQTCSLEYTYFTIKY